MLNERYYGEIMRYSLIEIFGLMIVGSFALALATALVTAVVMLISLALGGC